MHRTFTGSGWWPGTRPGYIVAGWSTSQDGNPLIGPDDTTFEYSTAYAVCRAVQTTTSTRSSAPLPAGTDSVDLQLGNHRLPAGSGLVITAHGFAPGTHVHFWIYLTPRYLGATVADKNGTATPHVTLDPSLVGVHHIQAVGVGPQGQPRNLAQTVTLTTAPLANTGINVTALLLLVLVLVGAGAGLLYVGRRRFAPRQH